MPIRFRCSYCQGLLSIAKRKSGAHVDCPKCSRSIVVPDLDDPVGPNEATERPTEVDLQPVAVPAEAAAAKRRPSARPNPSPAYEPPAEPVRKKPRPKDDPPLFENSDFDRLLDPAIKKATAPAPAPVEAAEPQTLTPAPRPTPPDDGGFYVPRGSVTILAVMTFFLIVIAFATGYIMGS